MRNRMFALTAFTLVLCVLPMFTALAYAPRPPPPPPTAEWLFMVYLDGDNDIDQDAYWELTRDIQEGAYKATTSVTIVVQIDRFNNWPGADNHNTRRYLVYNRTLILLQDMGELNMGDKQTLIDFATWAITGFSAKKYALVLWDHGGGWTGVCWDDHSEGDHLMLIELKTAFISIEENTGKTIDVVGFDACLMQMVEVAYQIKDYASVVVGSEEIIYSAGWPYSNILHHLIDNPATDAVGLGTIMVDDYGIFWDNIVLDATLSAIDSGYLDELISYIEIFADGLFTRLPYYRTQIENCRNVAEEFGELWDFDFVDLYHFVDLVNNDRDLSYGRGFVRSMLSIKNTINLMTILEYHGSDHPNAHGLSIMFENDSIYEYNYKAYGYLDFPRSGAAPSWNYFVMEYCS